MHAIESRLAELGVTLPDAPAPAANYVPFVQVGNLVHISGQISQNEAGLIKGRLGEDLSFEQGAEAAKRCAISLLAQLKKATGGDWDRLDRAVKLVGFVNSTPDFTDQPKVIN
ncbi:MAG: RidA family protein, partial [Tabrizicola sp.]